MTSDRGVVCRRAAGTSAGGLFLQGRDLLAQTRNAPGHGVSVQHALAPGLGQLSDDHPQFGIGGWRVLFRDGFTQFASLGSDTRTDRPVPLASLLVLAVPFQDRWMTVRQDVFSFSKVEIATTQHCLRQRA